MGSLRATRSVLEGNECVLRDLICLSAHAYVSVMCSSAVAVFGVR